MFRTRPYIKASVCSAVEIVLPPGVFMTTMPCRVAAFVSMLSTPTPARAMALSRWFPWSDSAVIFTPLRQIAPSNSARADFRASPLRPVRISTSILAADRNRFRPSSERSSRTMIFAMFCSLEILFPGGESSILAVSSAGW